MPGGHPTGGSSRFSRKILNGSSGVPAWSARWWSSCWPGTSVVVCCSWIGPSGSGKSSLLRAGMIPALQAGRLGLAGSAGSPPCLLTPGADLKAALARCHGRDEPSAPDTGVPARRIVVVDQFEEVFADTIPEAERAAFVAGLGALAAPLPSAAIVVVGMRADFYPRAVAYDVLADAIQGSHLVVGPMSEDEVRSVIVEPA